MLASMQGICQIFFCNTYSDYKAEPMVFPIYHYEQKDYNPYMLSNTDYIIHSTSAILIYTCNLLFSVVRKGFHEETYVCFVDHLISSSSKSQLISLPLMCQQS